MYLVITPETLSFLSERVDSSLISTVMLEGYKFIQIKDLNVAEWLFKFKFIATVASTTLDLIESLI